MDDEGDATDGDKNENYIDDATGSGTGITMYSATCTPSYVTLINPIAIANIVNPPTPQIEMHAVKAEIVKDTPMTPIDVPATAPVNGGHSCS